MNGEKRTHPRVVEGGGAPPREPIYGETAIVARSSVSWGSIFAGVFTAILSYLILMSLGLGVAGGVLRGGVGDWGNVGIGTGIWLVLATLISLFIGGYAGGRVSGLVSTRVGRTQGAVVASVFFLIMMMQAGTAIGTIGAGVGNVVGAAGAALPDVAQDDQVQQTVQAALGDLDLRSPPDEVAQGIAVRLLRGDGDGARRYLANQAGITEQQAQARIDQVRDDVEQALADAGDAAARVAQAAGWILFATFLLGGLAAMTGGDMGTRHNLQRPIADVDDRTIREGGRERAA